MTWLYVFALGRIRRPVGAEELANAAVLSVEELREEEVDDAGGLLEVRGLRRRAVHGQEGLQQVHVRVLRARGTRQQLPF